MITTGQRAGRERGTGNRTVRALALSGLLFAGPAFAQAAGQQPAAAAAPNAPQQLDLTAVSLPVPAAGRLVAITNATIMPASGPTIQNGTIIIRDGKIT